MADDLNPKALEAAARAYAEATNYYVPFHAGLSSPSADEIRSGVRAAIRAYLAALNAEADARHTRIMEILDNPEPPTEALKEAVRKYGSLRALAASPAPAVDVVEKVRAILTKIARGSPDPVAASGAQGCLSLLAAAPSPGDRT